MHHIAVRTAVATQRTGCSDSAAAIVTVSRPPQAKTEVSRPTTRPCMAWAGVDGVYVRAVQAALDPSGRGRGAAAAAPGLATFVLVPFLLGDPPVELA